MDDTLLSALQSIDVADLTRDEWVRVGMALKLEGADVSIWDEWSKPDIRYHDGECRKLWNGFNGNDDPVEAGTIMKMAIDRGWTARSSGHELGWADKIQYDGPSMPSGRSIEDPQGDWNPTQQLIDYLSVLFDPDDRISFVSNQVRQGEDGRWRPAGAGYSDRTAGELIESLKKSPDDITDTICSYRQEAGAWIRINPVDGNGVHDYNVTKYRYVLVESDTIPVDEQLKRFRQCNIPIAALVYSGGKSLHAVVHIDADEIKDHGESLKEYKRRVAELYDYLGKHGIEIDEQNKNPARLSRMPGVMRNGKRQYLVATNIGCRSWRDWKAHIDASVSDLPPVDCLGDYYNDPPELAEEIISGILRMGHKMLIAGPSKSGKSFAMAELCVGFAAGIEWLGHKCRQGRVLYINLEIDRRSCINRFIKIGKALNVPDDAMKNIDIWNLRGHARPLNELVPKIITAASGKGYLAVVIDPIYKVITGDENSATDMSAFCNCFDQIATATGCAVIYCHHYAKGAAGDKKAMDRPSGSGVFARDPDAQITISELEMDSDFANCERDPEYVFSTPWRCEFTLREFPPLDPVNVWFKYPLHEVDVNHQLDKLKIVGASSNHRSQQDKLNDTYDRINTAYTSLRINGSGVSLKDLAVRIGVGDRQARKLIEKIPDRFKVERSMVIKLCDDE